MAVTYNQIQNFRPLVNLLVSRLREQPEVLGIVLLGGLGLRQFIDRHSDLDIAVFLSAKRRPILPPFSFILPHRKRRIEINLSQEILTRQKKPWSSEKREAYRHSIVVYDPTGHVSALLAAQTAVASNDHYRGLVAALNQISWRGVRHSRSVLARGFPESAHLLINDAVELVIRALFHLNEIEPPHGKWRIDLITRLPIIIPCARQRIGEVLIAKSLSAREIERRVRKLEEILEDLIISAKSKFPTFPENIYWHWARYVSDRQLDPNNIIDVFCDKLSYAAMNASDLEKVRGVLSLAVLKRPRTANELIALAMKENRAPPRLLKKARKLLRNHGEELFLQSVIYDR